MDRKFFNTHLISRCFSTNVIEFSKIAPEWRLHTGGRNNWIQHLPNYFASRLIKFTSQNFSLLQCETCTSSPTTDAFNQGSSSYASLTGVQLTRVVSPVNKRAPSNGGAFAKGESSTEKIFRARCTNIQTSGKFEKRHRIPPPAFHFTFPLDIPKNVKKKKNEGAHLFTGSSSTPSGFLELPGTFRMSD